MSNRKKKYSTKENKRRKNRFTDRHNFHVHCCKQVACLWRKLKWNWLCQWKCPHCFLYRTFSCGFLCHCHYMTMCVAESANIRMTYRKKCSAQNKVLSTHNKLVKKQKKNCSLISICCQLSMLHNKIVSVTQKRHAKKPIPKRPNQMAIAMRFSLRTHLVERRVHSQRAYVCWQLIRLLVNIESGWFDMMACLRQTENKEKNTLEKLITWLGLFFTLTVFFVLSFSHTLRSQIASARVVNLFMWIHPVARMSIETTNNSTSSQNPLPKMLMWWDESWLSLMRTFSLAWTWAPIIKLPNDRVKNQTKKHHSIGQKRNRARRFWSKVNKQNGKKKKRAKRCERESRRKKAIEKKSNENDERTKSFRIGNDNMNWVCLTHWLDFRFIRQLNHDIQLSAS